MNNNKNDSGELFVRTDIGNAKLPPGTIDELIGRWNQEKTNFTERLGLLHQCAKMFIPAGQRQDERKRTLFFLKVACIRLDPSCPEPRSLNGPSVRCRGDLVYKAYSLLCDHFFSFDGQKKWHPDLDWIVFDSEAMGLLTSLFKPSFLERRYEKQLYGKNVHEDKVTREFLTWLAGEAVWGRSAEDYFRKMRHPLDIFYGCKRDEIEVGFLLRRQTSYQVWAIGVLHQLERSELLHRVAKWFKKAVVREAEVLARQGEHVTFPYDRDNDARQPYRERYGSINEACYRGSFLACAVISFKSVIRPERVRLALCERVIRRRNKEEEKRRRAQGVERKRAQLESELRALPET